MSSPRPLGVEDLSRIVAGFTYRPGWTFAVDDDPFEGPALRIVGPVEDAYHSGEALDLGITTYMPPMYCVEDVVRFVTWRLQRVESHESREWLRYRGELVSDPHAAA